jgi:hypothetical protein
VGHRSEEGPEVGLPWKEGGNKILKMQDQMCLILLNISFCGSRNTFLFIY